MLDLDDFKSVNDRQRPRGRRRAAARHRQSPERGPAPARLARPARRRRVRGAVPRRRRDERRRRPRPPARRARRQRAGVDRTRLLPGRRRQRGGALRDATAASTPPRPTCRASAPATRSSWATLADAVDGRTDGAPRHSRSVAEHATAIARGLGWGEPQLSRLRLAATLHDVGPEILEQIDGLDEVAAWVRHSHEHFDGSGHPDGLAGDAIPAASRIVLVADAFDAMTSEGPFGGPLTIEAALAELQRHAGTGSTRRAPSRRCAAATPRSSRASDPRRSCAADPLPAGRAGALHLGRRARAGARDRLGRHGGRVDARRQRQPDRARLRRERDRRPRLGPRLSARRADRGEGRQAGRHARGRGARHPHPGLGLERDPARASACWPTTSRTPT